MATAIVAWLSLEHWSRLRPTALTPEAAISHTSSREPASTRGPARLRPSTVCSNLHQLVCSQKGDTVDPTGVVRPDVIAEQRVLAVYREIIERSPDKESDEIDDELAREIYTPKRRTRIEGAFKFAQKEIEAFIERQSVMVFGPAEKKLLKRRIHAVKLEIPPPARLYDDEPDLLTKTGAFYERLQNGTMRIRVGGAYVLAGDSWFNLVSTMSHELAHAIDPCELKAIDTSISSYVTLSACLVRTGAVASPSSRLECGENDQLSEAFADWMAAQVTGEALKRFATEFDNTQLLGALINSVRDLCEQDDSLDEPDTTFHPAPGVRIAEIFGKNPVIQELMGCPASSDETPYCTLNP